MAKERAKFVAGAEARIGPGLRLGRVPRMAVEAGLFVIRMLVGQAQLPYGVVDALRALARRQRVFEVKGRRHVQPVEPHLLRIAFLMPETAIRRARLLTELPAQRIGGGAIPRIARLLIEEQELFAVADIIQIEGIVGVIADASLGVDKGVHAVLDVIKVRLFARQLMQHFHAAPDDAVIIAPALAKQALAPHRASGHLAGETNGADTVHPTSLPSPCGFQPSSTAETVTFAASRAVRRA